MRVMWSAAHGAVSAAILALMWGGWAVGLLPMLAAAALVPAQKYLSKKAGAR